MIIQYYSQFNCMLKIPFILMLKNLSFDHLMANATSKFFQIFCTMLFISTWRLICHLQNTSSIFCFVLKGHNSHLTKHIFKNQNWNFVICYFGWWKRNVAHFNFDFIVIFHWKCKHVDHNLVPCRFNIGQFNPIDDNSYECKMQLNFFIQIFFFFFFKHFKFKLFPQFKPFSKRKKKKRWADYLEIHIHRGWNFQMVDPLFQHWQPLMKVKKWFLFDFWKIWIQNWSLNMTYLTLYWMPIILQSKKFKFQFFWIFIIFFFYKTHTNTNQRNSSFIHCKLWRGNGKLRIKCAGKFTNSNCISILLDCKLEFKSWKCK